MRFLLALLIISIGLAGCTSSGGSNKSDAATKGAEDALSQMNGALSQAEITPEDEYYLGRAVAARVLSQYPPYQGNPALASYLNAICAALVIHSDMPAVYNGYHVTILDSPEFNAFATSGGHILITRGLIAAAPSEDALAGVVAHEIAHIQLRHGVQLVENLRVTDDLSKTADRSSELAADELEAEARKTLFDNSVREMATGLMVNGYSQEQEFEADKYALGMLAKTGYSPSGLIDVLKVLESRQASQAGGFNTTHPSPSQRIANSEREIGAYTTPDTRSFRTARFQAATK
ncbi:MAG: M48 family metalloprotease [Spirochaetaceae bacterium]|jgi:predicted Zn-dependent protease|nr:M48 family metalloprotease [Spirochaetaceae bacterium]